MTNDFKVVHFSPGRLRVRMTQVAQNSAFAADLMQMLLSVEGIRQVQTSGLTGSVLVLYDPQTLDIHSLMALGRMLDIIPEETASLSEAILNSDLQAGAVQQGAARLGQALGNALEQGGRMAGQVLDPKVAMPLLTMNAVARRLGIGAALSLSPGIAAAWVIASLLIGPRRQKGNSSA